MHNLRPTGGFAAPYAFPVRKHRGASVAQNGKTQLHGLL